MNEKAVVLGLSDGVDSAVAAKVLKDAGYEVYGLYLNISGNEAGEVAKKSAELTGIHYAKAEIADALEEHVCKPFAEGYLRGETINPCIGCNRNMKFEALLKHADEVGAKWIATGHYSRIADGKIYTGYADNDQSYMLCRLKKEQADRLLLPLDGMKKEDVREIARKMNLSVAEKPDSREICFIKKGKYYEWLSERENVPGQGDALLNGEFFARHEGIHKYTVGQRFGETDAGRRVYVSDINAEKNELILSLWDDLFKTEIEVRDIVWLVEPEGTEIKGQVRARHTRWEMPDCTIYIKENGRAHVVTKTALRAPAKGQTAAFYDGELLLGGGTIDG